MSNITRRVSRSKNSTIIKSKNKTSIKSETSELDVTTSSTVTKDVRWDDIATLSNDSTKILSQLVSSITLIRNVIDKEELLRSNMEIIELYTGIANQIDDINKNIKSLRSQHSKEENGKLAYYSGPVNDKKEDADLYAYLLMGYGDILKLLSAVSESSLMTLNTKITEVLEAAKEKDTNNKKTEGDKNENS